MKPDRKRIVGTCPEQGRIFTSILSQFVVLDVFKGEKPHSKAFTTPTLSPSLPLYSLFSPPLFLNTLTS